MQRSRSRTLVDIAECLRGGRRRRPSLEEELKSLLMFLSEVKWMWLPDGQFTEKSEEPHNQRLREVWGKSGRTFGGQIQPTLCLRARQRADGDGRLSSSPPLFFKQKNEESNWEHRHSAPLCPWTDRHSNSGSHAERESNTVQHRAPWINAVWTST